MTRKRRPKPKRTARAAPAMDVPKPVDVHEGVPDCSQRQSTWRWAVMTVLFVGWVAFLVYCWLAG